MVESQPRPGSGLVAIVPAREGSERLPGKNLLPLNGKPLIRWTLEAAQESNRFDRIVVTSDDPAILAEATQAGVESIERPAHLATDTATSADVILHALDELAKEGMQPKRFMLLQPTSPLRNADDIRAAIRLMDERGSDCIVSVCPAEHSPLWSGELGKNDSLDAFLDAGIRDKRSQDLPQFYRLNGAIYLADVSVFRRERNFFVPNSHAFIMPVNRSVDIDTGDDLLFAEFLLERNALMNN